MTKYTQYGPGDPITWGPCTGHPGDPRTEDLFPPDDDEENEDDLENEDEDHDYDIDESDDPEDDEDYDHEPSDN